MNFAQSDGQEGKAELTFDDGEYKIIKVGAYVLCNVTGNRIPLEELRYWNVDLQEAYVSAEAANKRLDQLQKDKE